MQDILLSLRIAPHIHCGILLVVLSSLEITLFVVLKRSGRLLFRDQFWKEVVLFIAVCPDRHDFLLGFFSFSLDVLLCRHI